MKFKDADSSLKTMKKEGHFSNQKLKYDPVELEIGIQVEHEHFEQDALSKQIALDHLAENPRYYLDLCKIDSECRAIAKKILSKLGFDSIEDYKDKQRGKSWT